MMAWNAYVLLGAIVGAFLFGMNHDKVTWKTTVWFIGALLVLAWVEGRYAAEAPDDADRALIVDTWTGRKVGLLFNASHDAPDGDSASLTE
jgi:hypothetical protein